MSKSLRKDFYREIKKSFSRFISIMLIVVLGVAFYSGIRSAMPAMKLTADRIYDEQGLMDIRVVGTLGLTADDLEKIREIEGVQNAEGSFSNDFICLANSSEVVTKVFSMPDKINDIKIEEGRYPEKYNETVVSREFLEATGFKTGDFVTFLTGTEDSVFDTMASETYQIVGVASSAYFLNGDIGTSTIGDGVVDGFAVIPTEAFVTDVYTSIYISVEGAAELDCFSDEYQAKIDTVIERVKAISDKRCDIRYSEVRSQTSELLEEKRNQYYEAEVTVNTELAEAYQKLLDTEQMLAEQRETFENEKKILENAETELPLKKQQSAEAETNLAQQEASLLKLKAALEENRSKVEEAEAKYQEIENNPDATEQQKSDAKNALLLVQNVYAYTEKEVADGEKKLEEAKKQIADGKNTIAQVEKVLADKSAITDAEKKLTDAEIELQRGKEQYEISKQDAAAELADASAALSKAETDINNMEEPVWYVLDRNTVESYMSYKNDSESIGAIGTVFPIIFFLVAALVSLTTMTRMVEEQRTQIGTLKALGYSKLSIAGKYLAYALLASVIGSVIGVFLGEYTLPSVIVTAYKSVYYNLGENVVRFNVVHGVTAAFAAVFCTTFAALAACFKELRSVPAELMRPEAPKVGKRILIERVSPVWDRLNFAQKAAARNLFRYKKRFFMTLFGVGGCMALLLVGMGIRDSVTAMADNQYGKVFTFDGIVSVDSTLTRAQRRAMLQNVYDISDVESILTANRTMVYGSNGETDDNKNAYLVVPSDITAFEDYVNMKERAGLQSRLMLSDEGVIITEKYADLLGVKSGDSIFIKLSESDNYVKEVKVAGVTENYIFNYIYMTPNLYQSLYSTAPDVNMLMIKTADAANVSDLSERLLKINGVTSVTMNSDELASLNSVIRMLYFIIIIMIIAAGVLAFVVLYNLNNINISERRRELATIKLLGFYDGELAGYVYRENVVLTILGTLLGVVLGIFLHRFVMVTVETDIYMFGRDLSIWSIIIGAVLTLLFAAAVNFVMYFKLKKIDMVESLKSVE